jgi:hypothetical protein
MMKIQNLKKLADALAVAGYEIRKLNVVVKGKPEIIELTINSGEEDETVKD